MRNGKYGIVMLAWMSAGCGTTNFFSSAVDKQSDDYLLEQARVEIDQKQYSEALVNINKMEGDSNEKRLTWTSAILGQAGLGILDIYNSISSAKTGGSGSDDIFNSLDDSLVFGSGDIRTSRIAALHEAYDVMAGAPDQSTGIRNIGCLFAGLLALPAIKSGKEAITEATINLEGILGKVSGAGANSEQCPGIDLFEANLNTIDKASADIKPVLETIRSCPILNLKGDTLNVLESAVTKLYDNADKGCQEISCTGIFCQALKLTCISTLIDTSSNPVAGDGKIATCELVQNCMNGGCF